MLASREGHTEAVASLIQAEANVNTITRFKDTAVMFAARNGHPEVLASFLMQEQIP